jgi:hypothetical protein
MDAELKQHMQHMEARIVDRPDSMEDRVVDRVTERVAGRIDAVEERMRDAITRADLGLESKLIAEFWKWGLRNRHQAPVIKARSSQISYARQPITCSCHRARAFRI